MLQYRRFTVNMVQVNTYLVWDESGEAIVVDPGFFTADEQQVFANFMEVEGLKLTRSLATHMHFDHILGARFVEERYGISTEVPLVELAQVPSLQSQFTAFGLPLAAEAYDFRPMPLSPPAKIGDTELEVMEAPGHSPGHVCYYHAASGLLFCGDVLFCNGFGRYDLWGGSYEALMASIKRLLQLPSETKVLTGHGPETTIGAERTNFKP